MVIINYGSNFKEIFKKIKANFLKEKIIKQIEKIKENPKIGKPMKYARKGTREVYVKPFRLSYAYIPHKNKIILLDLYHKKKQ